MLHNIIFFIALIAQTNIFIALTNINGVRILKYEIVQKWVENVHFCSAPFSPIQEVLVAYHLYECV